MKDILTLINIRHFPYTSMTEPIFMGIDKEKKVIHNQSHFNLLTQNMQL